MTSNDRPMTALTFRTLDDVEYGRVDRVSPRVRRVIAENPSKFTYRGTGTYILGDGDVVVIDPGPILDSHRDALAAALRGERVRAILVTHCHSDHSPLAAWLAAESGAATFGFGPHPYPDEELLAALAEIREAERAAGEDDDATDDDGEVKVEESVDHDFTPDVTVSDGETLDLGGLTITGVHTPGHTSNHMCWALSEESALFTGDHVMGWSTTVVSPPDGDMAAYIDSLRKVAARRDAVLWPTHGPPRDDAVEYVAGLVEHRLERERGVLDAVRSGLTDVKQIVGLLYAAVDVKLHKAAGYSVWGHLVKLVDDGLVVTADGGRPLPNSTYVPV